LGCIAEALVDETRITSQRHVFEGTSLERVSTAEEGLFFRIRLDAEGS
jgi:hypothetical protein